MNFTLHTGLKILYPIPRGQRTGADRQSVANAATPAGRKGTKASQLDVNKLNRRPSNSSRTKLRKMSTAQGGQKVPPDEFNRTKMAPKKTPAQEKADMLSRLVEDLNVQQGLAGGSKKNNPRQKNRFMSFDEVVAAAIGKLRREPSDKSIPE